MKHLLNPSPPEIILVGAGGVMSYLLPVLVRLLANTETRPLLRLFDGDILEERNLDRQLFRHDQVGQPKAEALAALHPLYPITPVKEFFYPGQPIEENALLICAADNHPARAACLQSADQTYGSVIIAANETTDAHAYYYTNGWRGGPLDPRVRYREILSDRTNDPVAPLGCASPLALATNPQLPTANQSAANFALWLFQFWFMECSQMDEDSRPFWPIEHRNTFSRFSTLLWKDLAEQQPKEINEHHHSNAAAAVA